MSRQNLVLIDALIDRGDSIREKLDKRAWRCGIWDSAQEALDYFVDGNGARTRTELIEPMKEFIIWFEALERGIV